MKKRSFPIVQISLNKVLTWQERLSNLNINNTHKSRTCDIFVMMERQESCITAIQKFHRGAKLDTSSGIKCITYDDILSNIEYFSKGAIKDTANESLYKEAAQDALEYLNSDKTIPCSLMANLIKLEIIYRIKKDVSTIQRAIHLEKLLEKERQQLSINPDQGAATADKGKGKDAGKVQDAGKDKGKVSPSDKKYDICDPGNVVKYKETSKLVKVPSSLYSSIEIEPKNLYFILACFYDVRLIHELFNITIPVTGILELCKRGDLVFPFLNYETEKSEEISNFWTEIYDCMHSDKDCPKSLHNVFHMTVFLNDLAFDENTLNDDNFSKSIFMELSKDIKKLPDIQRHYVSYIRHLKIDHLDCEPRKVQPTQIYDSIMNVIPPDCTTLFPILYAVVEDISDRIPDPCADRETSSTTLTGFNLTDKESTSIRSDLLNMNVEAHRSIKCCTAHILKTAITRKTLPSEKQSYNPKVGITISTKPILVDENNELELLLNGYKKLYPKLINIHLDKLVQSQSVLLWENYPLEWVDSRELLNRRTDVDSVAETLDVTKKETQFIVHTILFNSLCCETLAIKPPQEDVFNLQLIFPKKEWFASNVTEDRVRDRSKIAPVQDTRVSISVELPDITYSSMPNVHEAKNIFAYQWHEAVNQVVMLQELYKAEQSYLCLDHVYCKYDDTILLRFHNALDDYGIYNKRWNANLRTAIGIREFCKYIVQEDAQWLSIQEQVYQEERDELLSEAQKLNRIQRKQFYRDLIFDDLEFIHRGSLKEKLLQGDQVQELPPPPDKKGKPDLKDNKKEDPKKGKDNSTAVTRTSAYPALEKISEPVNIASSRRATLRERTEEEPFKFHAYATSDKRFQLAGTTTVFQSQDGYKVTVETARFQGHPKTLSLNSCVDGHNLVLHYSDATIIHPFAFHFVLSDKTFIGFSKPPPKIEPDKFLCEKICRSLKNKEKRRQHLYFVSEKQLSVSKCFKIPQITKRNLILSEKLLSSFLKQLSIRKIPTKLIPTESLSNEDLEKFHKAVGSEESYEMGSTDSDISEHPSQLEAIPEGVEEEEPSIQYQTIFDRSKKFSDTNLKQKTILEKRLLKKLKKTIDSEMPVFKICSSPLHKYQYVKRVKSHAEVQIGTLLKRITYKQPVYKSKVNLTISKMLPVTNVNPKPATYAYNIKACLPSGLMVESIDALNNQVYIRQTYLDKGPQCQNIYKEYSRTFTRTGNIIIKKDDGDIEVLNVHGQMVRCEVPSISINNKEVFEKHAKPNLAALNVTNTTRFQKYLHKSLNRMKRHVIDSPKSQYLLSHKAYAKFRKRVVQDLDQMYLIQDSIAPFKRFSLMTGNGNLLKVVPSIITEEQKLYISSSYDYLFDEMLSEREDGVQTKIDRESTMVTQFPDGTRISTWIDIEPELFYMGEPPRPDGPADEEQQTDKPVELLGDEEEASKQCLDNESLSQESKFGSIRSRLADDDKIEGFVSVFLNYRYEHPNYATILVYGRTNESEIVLPNDASLLSSEHGEYVMKLNKVSCQVKMEDILMEARLCNECLQTATMRYSIQPLYDYNKKLSIAPTSEFFRTTDTFGKFFKVTYGGHCSKKAQYDETKVNLAQCKNHFVYEPHKLFILNRNLLGSKLWDINFYKKRLREGTRSNDVTIKNFKQSSCNDSCIELRTSVNKPFHERFLIAFAEPYLMLSKNRVVSNKSKEAYAIQQRITKLPSVINLRQLHLISMEICSAQYPNIYETAKRDFEVFLTQLDEEPIVIKQEEEPTESVKPETSSDTTSSSDQFMTIEMKQQTWLQDLEHCKREFQDRVVPKYFDLSYPYCKVGGYPPGSYYGESYECDCNLLNFEPPPPLPVEDDKNSDIIEYSFTPKSPKPPKSPEPPVEKKSEPEEKVSLQTKKKKVELRQIVGSESSRLEIVIRQRIVNETSKVILKMVLDLPADISTTASQDKVTKATKVYRNSLKSSVKSFEFGMPQRAYAVCSAHEAIKLVSKLKLNAVEWILLNNNVAALSDESIHEFRHMDIQKIICKTEEECKNNAPYVDRLSTYKEGRHVSGFQIYNFYSNQSNRNRLETSQIHHKSAMSSSLYSTTKDDIILKSTLSEMLREYEKLPLETLNKNFESQDSFYELGKSTKTCKICNEYFSQNRRSMTYSYRYSTSTTESERNKIEFLVESPLSSIDRNIETIDSHTVTLQADDNENEESKSILFNVASLKYDEHTRPYTQKLPYEALQNIIYTNKLTDKFARTEPKEIIPPLDFSKDKPSSISYTQADTCRTTVDAKILDEDATSLQDPCAKVCTITATRVPFFKPNRSTRGSQTAYTENKETTTIRKYKKKLY